MERSLELNAGNPDNWLRYARVMEWYGFTPEPDGVLIRESLDNAGHAIDRAIALRPGEGFGYSPRAFLQTRRWNIDDQLSSDLTKAMELSPWEGRAQRQVMHAGMSAWPALNGEGRAVVLGAFSAAIEHQPSMAIKMLNIAEQYGRKGKLCNRLHELDFESAEGMDNKKCRNGD
jgi:hypothetical protein